MGEEYDCGYLGKFAEEKCPECGTMVTGNEGSFSCSKCGHRWNSE